MRKISNDLLKVSSKMPSLDLSNCAYFFAQALDNSGEAEYWSVSNQGARYDQLDMTDPRLILVRENIDAASMLEKFYFFNSEIMDVRMSLAGLGLISIRPSTLDINGRLSPVLMIFNINGAIRSHVAATLNGILAQMGRDLPQVATPDVEKFQKMLNLSRPVLFFTLFLSKIWNKFNA